MVAQALIAKQEGRFPRAICNSGALPYHKISLFLKKKFFLIAPANLYFSILLSY